MLPALRLRVKDARLALMYRTCINSIPLSGIIAQIISNNWFIKKEGTNSQWPSLDNRIIPKPGVAGVICHILVFVFC